MKICVSSQGQSLDSQICPRFGRTVYFILIDTNTMEYDILKNEGVSSSGGAGISAATEVINSGAKAVLTGNCGPKAFRTLQSCRVDLYVGFSGTVREAIEAFKTGSVQPSSSSNVDAHFGM